MKKEAKKTNLISNLSSNNPEYLITALESLIEVYKKKDKKEILISISIFSTRLGILEALVKYLKEELSFTYHQVAILLNRDDRTIWTTYQKALRKQKKRFSLKDTYKVPVSIFSDRTFGPLEALVIYIKEQGMSFKTISKILGRNYQTIWLSHKNGTKKRGK